MVVFNLPGNEKVAIDSNRFQHSMRKTFKIIAYDVKETLLSLFFVWKEFISLIHISGLDHGAAHLILSGT